MCSFSVLFSSFLFGPRVCPLDVINFGFVYFPPAADILPPRVDRRIVVVGSIPIGPWL